MPRSSWAQLPLFTLFLSWFGLFWFAVVDAPYLFDAALYGTILAFNLVLISFGSRRSLFATVPFAGIYLGLFIVFVGLAWKEAREMRHIREWRVGIERSVAATAPVKGQRR